MRTARWTRDLLFRVQPDRLRDCPKQRLIHFLPAERHRRANEQRVVPARNDGVIRGKGDHIDRSPGAWCCAPERTRGRRSPPPS